MYVVDIPRYTEKSSGLVDADSAGLLGSTTGSFDGDEEGDQPRAGWQVRRIRRMECSRSHELQGAESVGFGNAEFGCKFA